MPDFECRLKKYRQLKELTQEELAAQVGVRRETIMRLEKAQYNPSLSLQSTYRGRWIRRLKRFLFFRIEVFRSGCVHHFPVEFQYFVAVPGIVIDI